MNTEARRRAAENYRLKREKLGVKKATWWSTSAVREALEVLKEKHGTKDAAINKAVLALLAADEAEE
jgi:hypothetical protein